MNPQDEIVSEAFDDEAIIMRLSDGAYFSINSIGGIVWRMIEARNTIAEITHEVIRHYDVSSQDARQDLERLVNELMRERLVVVSTGVEQPAVRNELELREKLRYEPPQLEIHRDMQDLLALDPPFGPDCKCGANS